jgi:hypothetical protein
MNMIFRISYDAACRQAGIVYDLSLIKSLFGKGVN